MKVALVGYGKMGKAIEPILLERGHEIVLKIGRSNQEEFNKENLQKCDVAIEFSRPELALQHYQLCFEAGIPVVSGTTGWLEKRQEVNQWIQQMNASFFYAPNFSIGVNLFFKVNEFLAKLMNQQPQYEVEMEEIHHKQKLDSPSGTGIRTAEIILNQIERKENWVENVKKDEKELLINVKREDHVPGTHIVSYLSNEDTISLSHTAHSRQGFAKGAVIAAEWLIGKKGNFEMKDLLNF